MITSSSYTIGPTQVDGRHYVTEQHLLNDGRSISFQYLANLNVVDPEIVMQARALRVQTQLDRRNASLALASEGEISWTKLQWERRFTTPEWAAIQDFNATYQDAQYLTAEQKLMLRRGLAEYALALDVNPSDPQTAAIVSLYEALGLLNPGRAAEILNG